MKIVFRTTQYHFGTDKDEGISYGELDFDGPIDYVSEKDIWEGSDEILTAIEKEGLEVEVIQERYSGEGIGTDELPSVIKRYRCIEVDDIGRVVSHTGHQQD